MTNGSSTFMPLNSKYIARFNEGEYYHITARAVGHQKLFLTDDHRSYFLHRFKTMLRGYVTTLAYILIDNHVHWMVRANSTNELTACLTKVPEYRLKMHQRLWLADQIAYHAAIELQFKDFFISYAMAFNREQKRKGALFINPFRRMIIEDNSHYTQLIGYIHCNMIKHTGSGSAADYAWSSYRDILSDNDTLVQPHLALNWFGGKEAFIQFHQEQEIVYRKKIPGDGLMAFRRSQLFKS